VNLALDSVSGLLLEIKTIEYKYQFEQVSQSQICSHDIKRSRSSKAIQTLALIRSSSSRQRSRGSKKQRSLIGLIRWAICDRAKFEEQVIRVKVLIDGLEDILRAAGTVLPRENYLRPSDSESVFNDDNPPPYSSVVRIQPPQNSTAPPTTNHRTRHSVLSRLSDNSIFDMLEHHAGMKRYLTAFPNEGGLSSSRHRDLLSKLTTQQFKELRMDVFDELLRRQDGNNITPQCLPDIYSYHPKRNEARRKLSTISATKFRQLLFDIVSELECRFPHLKDPTPLPSSAVSTAGDLAANPSTVRCNQSRRWGCVGSYERGFAPPPYLQYRPAHQTTVRRTNRPHPSKLHVTETATSSTQASAVTPSSSRSSIQIFESFRVSMNDPTSKVLSAALRKYNIQASSQQYSLCITYGNHERKLEADEKPLLIFKILDREGKQPAFILRRERQEISAVEEDESPSPSM